MKHQKGSAIIAIILLFIIVLTVYLIMYKIKHPKNTTRNEYQSGQQSTPSNNQQPNNQQPNNTAADNTPVILEDGEIINPFYLGPNNLQGIRTEREAAKNQDTATSNSPTPDSDQNAISYHQEIILPNGKPIPLQSGLIGDIPQKYNNGSINININNSMSKSNIIVYLYHMRPLNTPPSQNVEELSAGALVNSGGDFNFTNMESGFYRLKWYVLSNKKSYQNNVFSIYKDNKYSYDREFRFKETPDSDKVRAMQIKNDFLK
ncbi:hypothetical protein [Acinetobacter sp. P1(2025)]|uniref:hypothetical protein n=1 Tax=Acinetobacter sp. P1(2025) TaxID=3446120 RepID=UPI003F53744B